MFSPFYSKMHSANTYFSTSISFGNLYPEKQIRLERRRVINAGWHSRQQATKYTFKIMLLQTQHRLCCSTVCSKSCRYILENTDEAITAPSICSQYISLFKKFKNCNDGKSHRKKRKGTWTLSETRATFLFKRPIMMENHSERQRRNRDPIKD